MIRFWTVVIIFLALVLAGCNPTTEDISPEGVENIPDNLIVVETTESPAIVSVTPSPSRTLTKEATKMPVPTPVNHEPEMENTEEPQVEVVTPVTVDLSKITPEPTVVGTPREMPLPGGIDPVYDMTQAMIRDLAQKLGVASSEITVIEVRNVTWSDSSLGCPQPGFGYMQVLTPGYFVILSSQGEEYKYHASGIENFILCENGEYPISPALDE